VVILRPVASESTQHRDSVASSGRPATRLAPSPTGALHLGNARTFLVNWALARQRGWEIVYRVEDLDGPRVKAGAIERVAEDLRWLGIGWDREVALQSSDLGACREAMGRLARAGLAYPCALTRAEIAAAATAPHAGDHENRFPPELRPELSPRAFDDEETNWRFVAADREVVVRDEVAGARAHNVAEEVGDFIVWTKRGQAAYQLAVTVDDDRQGITHVVRGDDLIPSAARQVLLREALGIVREPAYFHVPLVLGEDGRRLAKRHGDTRVETYRAGGVRAERVIGVLAVWSGVQAERAEMGAEEFAERFDLARMPREPSVFTREDDLWLSDASS